jgi:hypothetical protein
MFAGLERSSLPVKTGKICRSGEALVLGLLLNHDMELIEVGLPQPTLCDFE